MKRLQAELDAALADNAAWEELAQRFLAVGQYMADTLAGLTHHPALKAGGHIEAHGQIVADWADVAAESRARLSRPRPGAALLEEHRKALVRARNEGRTQADAEILRTADPPAFFRSRHPEQREYEAALSGYSVGVNHALDTIRSMLEPEQ